MKRDGVAFVGIDTAKARNAVAVAEGGRKGEIRYMGEFDNTPDAVIKLVRKLAERYETVQFCYEAGPTGYGLYRQIIALGHACSVVAPSLIPRKPGDRVKTNRRDAQTLARLLRAGELTAVWVPDEPHEAVRDLVRTRAMAIEDYRRKRQHVTSFLLRHGRSYQGGATWKGRHQQWLDRQSFAHPAQRLAFQEMLNAVRSAAERIDRLDAALLEIVPAWTMAPVVAALRRRAGDGDDDGRRSRRYSPLRASAAIDGVPRPGAVGAFDRTDAQAGRVHQGRQHPRPEGTHRSRVDLSARGGHRRESPGTIGAAARADPRYRLEGAVPLVRALSAPSCQRQEADRGRHRDRPRNCGLPVGDRAPRRTGVDTVSGMTPTICRRPTMKTTRSRT
jgi:transposase